jgi:hypothetical protein
LFAEEIHVRFEPFAGDERFGFNLARQMSRQRSPARTSAWVRAAVPAAAPARPCRDTSPKTLLSIILAQGRVYNYSGEAEHPRFLSPERPADEAAAGTDRPWSQLMPAMGGNCASRA